MSDEFVNEMIAAVGGEEAYREIAGGAEGEVVEGTPEEVTAGDPPEQDEAAQATEAEAEPEAEEAAPESESPATLAWRMRQAQRRARELEERDRQRELQLRQALEYVSRQQPQPEEADADDDDEFADDPAARRFLEAVEKRLNRRLEPVVKPMQEGQQRAQQEQQMRAQQEAQAQAMRDFYQRIGDAEAEYASTPEGKGYFDRVREYGDHLKGYHEKALSKVQAPPGFADQVVQQEIAGLVNYAMGISQQTGRSPAEVIDSYVQAALEGRPAPAANVQPAPAPAHAAAPAPATPRKPSSPAVQAAKRAVTQGAAGREGAPAPAAQEGPSASLIKEVGVDRALPSDLLDRWAAAGTLVSNVLKISGDLDAGHS